MSTQYSNHRDTPLRRFNTFWWGLAYFGLFGLVSVIVYSMTDKAEDAEDMRAKKRMEIKEQVAETQATMLMEKEEGDSKQMPPAEMFNDMKEKLMAPPKESKDMVPGSAAHKKAMDELAKGGGGAEGLKLFVSKTCNTCHGMDGNTPIAPIYPKLGGQPADYLLQQMKDFRDGKRTNGQSAVMKPLMAGITDEEMKILADWMSKLKKPAEQLPATHPGKSVYLAKGCVACHGADGTKATIPGYPNIAGQNGEYLLNQMKDIKSGARHNGQSAAMKAIMAGVNEADMKAIVEWLTAPAK